MTKLEPRCPQLSCPHSPQLLCQGEGFVPVCRKGRGYFMKNIFVIIRSSGFCVVLSIHVHLLELHCWSTVSSPLVESMKPLHLKSVFASSRMRPLLKFQNFQVLRSVCPRQISVGLYRRGNPMELIDDCTLFFFGILPHTLRQRREQSPSQKN